MTSPAIFSPTPTPSASSSAIAERFHRTVLRNPWIPHKPTQKQAIFLLQDHVREVLYGGAAGGGKTDALLMGALQYVQTPGYAALLLMKTYSDLSLPKAGMSRAAEWLSGTAARWSGDTKTWQFPSGATLTFGYLDSEGDEQRYKTAEFQYIAFDELTRFLESPYRFLFSRLRRLRGMDVPIRMRAGTNPGDKGHAWVKARFIPDGFLTADLDDRFGRPWSKGKRLFVPARLEDNPHLDQADYDESLAELDPVTRAQQRHGDWKAHAGGRFQRRWFRRYRRQLDALLLDDGTQIFLKDLPRAVLLDPANRKTKASNFTAMGAFGFPPGQKVVVLEIVREQLKLEAVVPTLDSLCARHFPLLWAGIEANGFQLALANEAREAKYRHMPTVYEMDPEGKSKLTRATPAILRAEQGMFYLPYDEDAEWVEPYISELCQFTGDEKQDSYTDQVDITAYAVLGADRFPIEGVGPEAVFVFGRGERGGARPLWTRGL